MNEAVILGSFVVCLLVFTGIGALASRVKQDTSEDYLVARAPTRKVMRPSRGGL
jgi:Na+/proline symporter